MRIKKQFFSEMKYLFFNKDLFHNIFAALSLLIFYGLVFSLFLPEGINKLFVTKLYTYLLILLLIPLLIIYIFLKKYLYIYNKSSSTFYKNQFDTKINCKDLLLVLLPMTPITRYVLINLDTLSIFNAILVIIFFFLCSIVVTFLLPVILKTLYKKILLITGLTFSYILFDMATFAHIFLWGDRGLFRIQLPILFILIIIFFVIYSFGKKYLILPIVMFFIVNTMNVVISTEELRYRFNQPSEVQKTDLFNYLITSKIQHKPDIIFLTYESYVGNETMLQYGIDNKEQELFLENKGFHIYDGIYTVGFPTISSISRLFNVSHDIHPLNLIKKVAGNSTAHKILKENGYKSIGILVSDWILGDAGSFYDYSFPKINEIIRFQSFKVLTKMIFTGRFRFDIIFESWCYEDYLSEKRNILSSNFEQPIFLYTHNKYPGHSETGRRVSSSEIENYKNGLKKANIEMKQDVELVLKNYPNAIIVVMGDHGPALTKSTFGTSREEYGVYPKSEINRLDIQDRYGCFLAIKWPDHSIIVHSKIEILQDLFPAIFAYLYNDNNIYNYRIEQRLHTTERMLSDVTVKNGVIVGGKDDGKLLFNSMQYR